MTEQPNIEEWTVKALCEEAKKDKARLPDFDVRKLMAFFKGNFVGSVVEANNAVIIIVPGVGFRAKSLTKEEESE